MPHQCATFEHWSYCGSWATGGQKSVLRRKNLKSQKNKQSLDDSRTSMPVQARPCPSGVETSKHAGWQYRSMYIWRCVNYQVQSLHLTRASYLPWLLRKSRPFIFKYRPLGPTYLNIWGILTIVGVWMINTYHHTEPEPSGCLGC